MTVGAGLTVIVKVEIQPEGEVYVIVSTPADMPVTTPLHEPTVATLVLLLLHVQPVHPVKVSVAPTHTVWLPVITQGA